MTDHPAEGKLLTCPFCGKLDAFAERFDLSSCYIQCNDCGAQGPTCCQDGDDEEMPGEDAARRSWNGRSPPSQNRELLALAMMRGGLATGHGDTFADLLTELEGQLKELQNRVETALRSQGGSGALNGRSYDAGLEAAATICDKPVKYEQHGVWNVEHPAPSHARVIRSMKGEQLRSPAESVVKPTDANISVLAEALYHCGCPAGGMTVGECAEQGVCGCSIRAERIKGCMGPDHQYFSRDAQQGAAE